MKKKTVVITALILSVAVVYLCGYFIFTAPDCNGTFSLDEYSDRLNSEAPVVYKNYGEITDCNSAAKAGRKVISDRYEGGESSLFVWIACDVRYDGTNDVWHVRTHGLFPVTSAHNALLSSDGTVIAVWGEK